MDGHPSETEATSPGMRMLIAQPPSSVPGA